MKRILISIISDQTIPNLLLIQELKEEYDCQVFISTPKMEQDGKSNWIEKAAGIEPGYVPRIVVDENKWADISQKLSNYPWPKDSTFIVNLTGGTKVMTLAVYGYFALPGNRITYIPIGRNQLEELYPDSSVSAIPINYRLKLAEYLLAHGIIFTKKDKSVKSFNELQHIYKSFRNLNYDVSRLNGDYPNGWKNYYTGTWFEEYLYYTIKRDLQLDDDAIFMSVSLKHFNQGNPSGTDKELDIVFTQANELYFVEAKVSLGNSLKTKDILDKTMFKLSAVNRHFGLRSHAHIITLADISGGTGIILSNLHRKAKVLDITAVLDRNNLVREDFSFSKLIT